MLLNYPVLAVKTIINMLNWKRTSMKQDSKDAQHYLSDTFE